LNKKTQIFILLLFLIISSCSTKKKTFFHRKYHDITAKYNGYFNGAENLKYGVSKLEKSNNDDYSKVLSVFKHNNITNSSSHHAYMDKSIKKASIVIQKHSINIRNKEYCKWIDDSYFLIAKSYYFKGQYLESKRTFEYIIKKWKKTYLAYESELWAAKCNISLGNLNVSESILEKLQSNPRFPEKLTKDLHLVFADLYMKQGIYLNAVDELRSACNLIKRKNKKSRFYYIIAQIYQDAGNKVQSKKYFELVLKSGPEYEMEFNAKMNLARTLRNKKDMSQMRENLIKMTKDEKNKDYLDQIYFTLAEMDIIANDSVSAIENYTLSTTYSTDNDVQKSLSFLQLGKIHYNKSDYFSSKTFYDSAYVFMPETHESYKSTQKTQKSLEKLIGYLETISLQDSLQTLSTLSEDERRRIVKRIIDDLIKKEQEELRQKQNQANRGNIDRRGRNDNFGLSTSGGKWYFYNPATLSYGLSEFRKKWGKRKLEDDWRRLNKKTNDAGTLDSISTNNTERKTDQNLRSEQYYLDQIPLTKDEIDASNAKIINAYYQSSIIFKEELEELFKSENMLEKLVKRFPENKDLTPLSYYMMYSLQKENNNIMKSRKTKQTLVQKFPESNYAKVLSDSNYVKKVFKKQLELDLEYRNTYNNFLLDSFELSYGQSLEKIQENITEENITYHSKYFLINTLSHFKINKDTSEFIKRLTKAGSEYPNTKVSGRCVEILQTLENSADMEERNTTALLGSKYRYNDGQDHYFLIVLPTTEVDINYIKIIVSDFNTKNYDSENLEISTMLMGLERYLLMVKTFKNSLDVSNYSKTLLSSLELLSELNKTDYNKIIISQQNFAEFYKNKDLEGYLKFFNNNYLENR